MNKKVFIEQWGFLSALHLWLVNCFLEWNQLQVLFEEIVSGKYLIIIIIVYKIFHAFNSLVHNGEQIEAVILLATILHFSDTIDIFCFNWRKANFWTHLKYKWGEFHVTDYMYEYTQLFCISYIILYLCKRSCVRSLPFYFWLTISGYLRYQWY